MFSQAKNTLTSDQYNELYRWYLSELQQPISAEFKEVAYNTPDFVMQVNLRNSIATFAAHKEYHYIAALNAALFDKDGKPLSKTAFMKAAKAISADFNKRFLSVEYDTAQAKAQSAAQWLEIQRNADVAPWLVYETAGDGRVRPEHALLDGVTKRYDDPWWASHTPPLGYRCRCTIGQATDGTETKSKDIPAVDVTPGFGANPLKSPHVFTEAHPYYSRVSDADKGNVIALANKYTFEVLETTQNSVLLKSKAFTDINDDRVVATAKKLVRDGNTVVLVPDGYYANGKNSELELNGIRADVKHFDGEITANTAYNTLKRADKQLNTIAVIDFEDYDYSSIDVFNETQRIKGWNNYQGNLKEVWWIRGNDLKVVKIK